MFVAAVDLRLTVKQHALRAEASAFCAGMRPLLEVDPEWRRQGMLSDGDSLAVNRALGEAGWIGMSWPVELGGRGLSRLTATLVEEVFGYHWLPLSSYLLSYKTIGAAIERFGSTALVEQLLPPIARGELVFCQGFSEAEAGSDLGALTTRAERRGDTFVVTGRKLWTSSAHLADWIYLAVRTDAGVAKHRGISVLVAPIDTPGIEVRRFGTLGGGYLCETFLDGVEIPVANLVGELNGGWDILMFTLDFERITAEKLGGVAWVLDSVEMRLRDSGPSGVRPRDGSRVYVVSCRRHDCSRSARLMHWTAHFRRVPPQRWRSCPGRGSCSGRPMPRSTCSGSKGSVTRRPRLRSKGGRQRSIVRRWGRRSPAARPRCSSS